jgi:hypothetical protein
MTVYEIKKQARMILGLLEKAEPRQKELRSAFFELFH